ncbi:MAG: triose-phosphate isomerase [Methanomassiliicoccales archaeon]
MSKIAIPAIIVNFKVYREVEGARAVSVALACQKVAEESGVSVSVCPPMVELSKVAAAVNIPVLAQHVDARKPGSNTGWITPEMIASAGAAGTLLNHSEHRLEITELKNSVSACKANGLLSVVCADSAETSGAVAFFKPDFIAVEPPELIGGDISVTSARPEVVSDAVNAVHRIDANIPVLCGAGVKTGKDVKAALDLGAKGVLLASGVVKATDVHKALSDLVSGI